MSTDAAPRGATTDTAKTRVLKANAVRVTPVIHLAGDADALTQAEEDRRRELDEVYRAGLTDGHRLAAEEGRTVAVTVAAELARLGDALRASAAQQVAADAAAIATTALEIARWVLDREVSADASSVVSRIEAALSDLATGTSVDVRVAPSLVPVVEEWASGAVEVHGDPSLAPGEARLVAGAAIADLTFAEAFRRAAAALGLDEGIVGDC